MDSDVAFGLSGRRPHAAGGHDPGGHRGRENRVAGRNPPGLEVSTWYALYAPAGTPRDVVDLLGREIKKITERADFKARVEQTGAAMSYMGPDELGKYTAEQVIRWTGIISKLNIPKQ